MAEVNKIYPPKAIITKIIMPLVLMGKFQNLICFSWQYFKAWLWLNKWFQGFFSFGFHISSILNYSNNIFKITTHKIYRKLHNSFSIRKFCQKSVTCFQSHFYNGNWFLSLIDLMERKIKFLTYLMGYQHNLLEHLLLGDETVRTVLMRKGFFD